MNQQEKEIMQQHIDKLISMMDKLEADPTTRMALRQCRPHFLSRNEKLYDALNCRDMIDFFAKTHTLGDSIFSLIMADVMECKTSQEVDDLIANSIQKYLDIEFTPEENDSQDILADPMSRLVWTVKSHVNGLSR